MDIKKLAPWNWFKKEEQETLPQPLSSLEKEIQHDTASPIALLHREMDQFFDNFLHGRRFGLERIDDVLSSTLSGSAIKPKLDIGADSKEYVITVEVPGVSKKDFSVEITENILTISGEKKQEKKAGSRNHYRIERSYGSFRRVLTLPEDAEEEHVEAKCNDGVLTVIIPRDKTARSTVKQIAIT